MRRSGVVLVLGCSLMSCASMRAEQETDAAQPLEHIRIDRDARAVEFDATVPITVRDEDAPHVYLELIACTPNTKEHEVLVVTRARPSDVHAALLMIGGESGAPGRWEWTQEEGLIGHPPSGDRVRVELVYIDDRGVERVDSPQDWIVHMETGERFPDGDWVFAGSRFVEWQGQEHYHADGAGTLIGLTTFGSEVLAWPEMISHESQIDEPIWIAAPDIPARDTPVVVRLTLIDD
ncbi:MAG: YdjY domain-containing protein [Phycisphaerales bacterium JB043]